MAICILGRLSAQHPAVLEPTCARNGHKHKRKLEFYPFIFPSNKKIGGIFMFFQLPLESNSIL
jgi:hypothetical protein